MPEIAKKVFRVPSKGTVQIDDRGIRKPNYLFESSKEGETEIEQTAKDLNHVRKAYFELIHEQEWDKKKMARMKNTAQKKMGGGASRSSRAGPLS